MAKEKASFIIRKKYRTQIEKLDNETAGMLFKAIMKLQDGETLENVNPVISILLSIMEEEWKQDNEKYEEVCNKNRENVKKRWSKNTTVYERIQSNTNGYDTIPLDTKHTDNDNDIYINNNIREDGKKSYYNNVWLSDDEYKKLIADYGKQVIEDYIMRLSEYILKKGDSYVNHNLTIRKWLNKAGVKKRGENDGDKPYDFSKDKIILPVRKRQWEISK